MSAPTIRPLLIRADASPVIGTGHVMRCFALAQAWRRSGGSAIFASAEMTPALEARLAREGFQSVRLSVAPGTKEDAAKTGEMAKSQNASWVVADSYNFGLDYQRVIKVAGLSLLLLDDYGHAGEYVADFVLNQNLTADAALYARRAPHTRLLLGARYALLREEFLRWRDWKREIPAVARKVLVTLGGADPDNVTGKIIEALRGLDMEARIVVGGSNPHLEQLKSKIGNRKSEIEFVVDATNMPELMAWADVAIAAGGTTSWELALMGLPSLVLVLADNQRAVADALDAAQIAQKTTVERVAEDLRELLLDVGHRAEMSRRGRQLVDGDGVNRVIACLRSGDLNLRRVREEDCRLIWEWANDREARAVSLSSEAIPWETHVDWFAARVSSPGCLFYVATNRHESPVGQIRYEIAGAEAVVSLSLAAEARGCGYGAALIARGSAQCFADSPVKLIRAYIKPDNTNSIRAFDRAGYADAGQTNVHGQTVRQFILERPFPA